MKKFLLSLIKLYQKTLSPDHGWIGVFYPNGLCRYSPSCSEYMYGSVEELGIIKGIFAGVARICRCHPLAASGVDPILKKGNN